jgi:hypothetical protein
MTDFGLLLVVILLLYLLECAVWVPAGSVAFRLASDSKRPIPMLTKPGAAARAGVAFSLPFSPGSAVIVCSPWPMALSPQGIASDPRLAARPGSRDFIAFDDMRRIERDQHKLLINGFTFVAAASEVQTRILGEMLQRLKETKLKDRAARIEREIAGSLDPSVVESRLQEYAEKTRRLRFASLALFVVIFIASPITVWRWGLAAAWPFLLAAVLLSMLFVAWDLRRAVRGLFPNQRETPWQALATVLLSPPAALHATQYVARDFARGFHPLAIAAARCTDKDFRELAAWVQRDMKFAPERGATNPAAADCDKWLRQTLDTAVTSLLRKKGCSPDELLLPPPRESEDVQSYCPRCLCQFVISQGVCADCGEISLRAFDNHAVDAAP